MSAFESGQPHRLDTVLLKVASRCNLDCSYCYVYHMGDEAWRAQPKLMSPLVIEKLAEALSEQYRLQKIPFSVVLHGGEPLLLGAKRLKALCARLREALPHACGIHLQTNGLLLTDEIIDLLVQFDVGVSVSIDGPENVHDRFRKDHKMRGSFSRVEAGISRLVGRSDARPLFCGVLCVIDPESDPADVYAALKATGAPSLDFLVRDGNWDQLPFGKASSSSTEYGEWLSRLLEIYLGDPKPPRVRILDDMLRLLLGGHAQKEGVGTTDYGIVVIEPDGSICKNDTLKVAYPSADQFEYSWSVVRDSLSNFLESETFDGYYSQQRPVSQICATCPDLAICGGGMVAHRWSAKRGFDNPTIFCADQRHVIAKMRSVVSCLKAEAV
ncbi:MAG: radical SAM protein [Halieaceae bacterium]|nr:radical SAM protein [Halieaceae bacterium]